MRLAVAVVRRQAERYPSISVAGLPVAPHPTIAARRPLMLLGWTNSSSGQLANGWLKIRAFGSRSGLPLVSRLAVSCSDSCRQDHSCSAKRDRLCRSNITFVSKLVVIPRADPLGLRESARGHAWRSHAVAPPECLRIHLTPRKANLEGASLHGRPTCERWLRFSRSGGRQPLGARGRRRKLS